MTDTKSNGWVLYDAQCPLCCAAVNRFAPLLRHYHFQLTPLQTPWVKQRLHLTDANLLTEMRLLRPDGQIHGGADALIALTRQIWWAIPIYLLAQIPGIKPILRKTYAQIAQRRTCPTAQCQIPIRHPKRPPQKKRVFFEMP